MRKSNLFIIILLLLLQSNLFSQYGKWTRIDHARVEVDGGGTMGIIYRAIDCPDTNDCIAVGSVGLVCTFNRITTDGGRTWFSNIIDTGLIGRGTQPRDVAYPSKNLCIILCDSNYYWRSTDSCRTWSYLKYPGIRKIWFYRIKMYDSIFGCVMSPNEIFLTTDGGSSWYKPFIDLPDSLQPSSYTDVSVPEKNTIISLAYKKSLSDYIVSSDDFGKTWKAFTSLRKRLDCIVFLDKLNGWGSGRQWIATNTYKSNIVHTTDGGASWEVQLDTLPPSVTGLEHIYFSDYNNGIAFGIYHNMWRTTNGGKYWCRDSSYNSSVSDFSMMDIKFFSQSNIIGVTSGEDIYRYSEFTSIDDIVIESEQTRLFPNPASDFIEIYSPSREGAGGVSEWGETEIKIYNSLGECVVDLTPCPSPMGEGRIIKVDVSCLAPGMYFVRIGAQVSKFIKY